MYADAHRLHLAAIDRHGAAIHYGSHRDVLSTEAALYEARAAEAACWVLDVVQADPVARDREVLVAVGIALILTDAWQRGVEAHGRGEAVGLIPVASVLSLLDGLVGAVLLEEIAADLVAMAQSVAEAAGLREVLEGAPVSLPVRRGEVWQVVDVAAGLAA